MHIGAENQNLLTQSVVAENKAKSKLGVIKEETENKITIFMPSFKSLVKPDIEYCIQFWPYLIREDIVQLEKVQKRATKMISGIGHFPYEDTVFVARAGDMIET